MRCREEETRASSVIAGEKIPHETPSRTVESVRAITMLGQPHESRRQGLSKCLFAKDDEVLAHLDTVTLLTKQTLKPHISQHSVVVVLSPKQDSSVEFVLTYLKIDFQIFLQFDSNYPEG